MLYGLETVSLRKRQESELKMLRFSLGVTRFRKKYIRGTAHVGRLRDKVREARLRWFGHVQRRDSEYIGRRMLDMELPGRRQRGRPKSMYKDVIHETMKLVVAHVEDADYRGHAPNETTDGVLEYFLPDLDQGITELLDSLRCNQVASDGPKANVPDVFYWI
ncbi:hypothetical protein QTP70_023861 [Hemibagrus guttatus]|uniref:Reverse transcriptase domain-containing protein n=1 Tax=Hemibagrus guttatus TaxID=175788 RepID=A0AAE0QT56_9TELE|nr:hypothetical protein QTP70_023861 [Hemibagrus guttatus]